MPGNGAFSTYCSCHEDSDMKRRAPRPWRTVSMASVLYAIRVVPSKASPSALAASFTITAPQIAAGSSPCDRTFAPGIHRLVPLLVSWPIQSRDVGRQRHMPDRVQNRRKRRTLLR